MTQGAVRSFVDINIQEGDMTIFLNIHDELNVAVCAVEIVQHVFELSGPLGRGQTHHQCTGTSSEPCRLLH